MFTNTVFNIRSFSLKIILLFFLFFTDFTAFSAPEEKKLFYEDEDSLNRLFLACDGYENIRDELKEILNNKENINIKEQKDALFCKFKSTLQSYARALRDFDRSKKFYDEETIREMVKGTITRINSIKDEIYNIDNSFFPLEEEKPVDIATSSAQDILQNSCKHKEKPVDIAKSSTQKFPARGTEKDKEISNSSTEVKDNKIDHSITTLDSIKELVSKMQAGEKDYIDRELKMLFGGKREELMSVIVFDNTSEVSVINRKRLADLSFQDKNHSFAFISKIASSTLGSKRKLKVKNYQAACSFSFNPKVDMNTVLGVALDNSIHRSNSDKPSLGDVNCLIGSIFGRINVTDNLILNSDIKMGYVQGNILNDFQMLKATEKLAGMVLTASYHYSKEKISLVPSLGLSYDRLNLKLGKKIIDKIKRVAIRPEFLLFTNFKLGGVQVRPEIRVAKESFFYNKDKNNSRFLIQNSFTTNINVGVNFKNFCMELGCVQKISRKNLSLNGFTGKLSFHF